MRLYFWLCEAFARLVLRSNSKSTGRIGRYSRTSGSAAVQSLEPRLLLTSIVVNQSTDDSLPATTAHMTLRDAIEQANVDPTGDSITFDSSLIGQTIALTQGALNISSSMTISGLGANQLTVSGSNTSQIFIVDNFNSSSIDQVTISGIKLTGGLANDSGPGTPSGGAIYNAEALTLTNDVFSQNVTMGDAYGLVTGGGAVFNLGTLSSTNNLFTGNAAHIGSGGGIDNEGTLTSTNDTFSGNTADLGSHNLDPSVAGSGGGIVNENGKSTISGDTFYGNSADTGAGVTNTNGAILISTNDTFSGNVCTPYQIFGVDGGTIGGGILNYYGSILTTTNDTISNNFGSGGLVSYGGTWNSLNTVVAGNSTAVGSMTPSDVITNGSVVNVLHSLIGDASSAGGIANGFNGNIVGVPINSIFVTNGGIPVLADNGGPNQTIALTAGSPAIGAGGTLGSVTADNGTTLAVNDITFIAVGDALKIGSEIVQVTGVTAGAGMTGTLSVVRAQYGTSLSTLTNQPITLATDATSAIRIGNDMGARNSEHSLTVTTTADDALPPTIPHLTLRDAIAIANADVFPSGNTTGDTISFASSLIASGPATITLKGNELNITNSMTITGLGAAQLSVSGNNSSRVFDVSSNNANVSITGLTITGGEISGPGGLMNANGTGIANRGTLSLANDTISGNSASSGISASDLGGGVYNIGTLTSTNDTISGNLAFTGGGIYNGGTLTSTNDTISGNYGSTGGGIYNAGTLSSTKDSISGNSATYGGGGIYNAATLTSTNDTVSGNSTSVVGGGGIYNCGTVTSNNDTISGNSTTVAFGGGIYNDGTLTSANDTISGNSAKNGGGGGIYNDGTQTTTNDTISGNSVSGNIYYSNYYSGGGILNIGTLTSTNDTISGNSASGTGGGVYNYSTLNLLNTLVADNPTGGDVASAGGKINAQNTLIDDTSSGLTNGVNGNIIGPQANGVIVTNGGIPVLANNGGPTQTIALVAGSPAIGKAGALTTLSNPITDTTSQALTVASTTYLAVGDYLSIDSEIVQVTAISSATSITVNRGQLGTAAATHAANAAVYLATDATGAIVNSHDLGARSSQHSLIVTTTADDTLPPTIPHTTLRDAIAVANADVFPVGNTTGDTITFAPGLTAGGPATISLALGVLNVTNTMTITGPGASNLTVSGNNASGIFNISPTTAYVTITGLTLSKGKAWAGGGIYNTGHLTLKNDVISNNTATTSGTFAAGGGIFNTGTLNSSNDTLSSNFATGASTQNIGGGVYNAGTLTSTSDTIAGNWAVGGTYAFGGGIFNNGTATISGDSIWGGNSARGASGASGGGGIFNATKLTSQNNVIAGNSAVYGGGVENLGTLTSTNDYISKNNANGALSSSAIGEGGAFYNGGTLTLQNDTISNNTATTTGTFAAGGGIFNFGTLLSTGDGLVSNFANGATSTNFGGGIYNGGTFTSSGDTIAGNWAVGGVYAFGGGVFNNATATITNDSIWGGNSARGASGANGGGGLFNNGNNGSLVTRLTSQNNVIAGNYAVYGAGLENNGTLTSTNDYVANNVANGALTTGSIAAGGGFYNGGKLTVSYDTLINNSVTGGTSLGNYGGGAFNNTLGSITTTGVSVTGNSATIGGGLINQGLMTSSNDTFSGNSATLGGGVINQGHLSSTNDTLSNNSATYVGGILNDVAYGGILTTTNDTIAGNFGLGGGGLSNYGAGATWNALNTIVAGNLTAIGSSTPSDVTNTNGTISASTTLIGDPNSAGGIAGGTNNNLIGATTKAIFQTNAQGNPLLAYNGGATQTILLAAGSPAIGNGGTLGYVTAVNGNILTVNSTKFLMVGDALLIGGQIVQVTAVNTGAGTITVTGQGTPVQPNASIILAYDQRGSVRSTNDIGAVENITTGLAFSVSGSVLTVNDSNSNLADQIWVYFNSTDQSYHVMSKNGVVTNDQAFLAKYVSQIVVMPNGNPDTITLGSNIAGTINSSFPTTLTGGINLYTGAGVSDRFIFNSPNNLGKVTIFNNSTGTSLLDFSSSTKTVAVNLGKTTPQNVFNDGTLALSLVNITANQTVVGGRNANTLTSAPMGNDGLDGSHGTSNTFVFAGATAVDPTVSVTPATNGINSLDFHNVTADLNVDLTRTTNYVASFAATTVVTTDGNGNPANGEGSLFNSVFGGQANNMFTTGGTPQKVQPLTVDGHLGASNDFVFTQATGTQADTLTPSSNGKNKLDFSSATSDLTVNLTGTATVASFGTTTVNTNAASEGNLFNGVVGGQGNNTFTTGGAPQTVEPLTVDGHLGASNDFVFTQATGTQADTLTPSNNGKNKLDFSSATSDLTVNLTGTATVASFGTTTVNTNAANEGSLFNYVIGGQGYNKLKTETTGVTLDGHLGSSNAIIGVTGDRLLGGIGNDAIYVNTDGSFQSNLGKTSSGEPPTMTPTILPVYGLNAGAIADTVVNTGNGIFTTSTNGNANNANGGDTVEIAGYLSGNVTVTTGAITGLTGAFNNPVKSNATNPIPSETINVNYANIKGNLNVNGATRDGLTNDDVLISSTIIGGNLTATLASGNDLYSQQLCTIGGNCSIVLGNGTDNEAFISGQNYSTSVTSYIGTDGLVNDSGTPLGNLISGTLTVNGATGSDLIILDHATVKQAVTLNGGSAGGNTVGLSASVFYQAVTLNGGSGGNNTLDGPINLSLANTFILGLPTINNFQTINGTL